MQAGSTNVSSVARRPAAIVSDSTPANVTTTPRTNIVVTASHGCGATTVPSAMSTAPLKPSPAYASARFCRLPGKSASTISANDPNIVNSGVCEAPIPEADRRRDRHDDRRPQCAPQAVALRVASLQPLHRPVDHSRGQHVRMVERESLSCAG